MNLLYCFVILPRGN